MRPKLSFIPFFTDNDVPDGVGDALLDLGHEVTRLRDVMLTNSPDPVVAATCREQGLVLITHNWRHFKAIAQQYEHKHGEPERLCRVELECSQVVSPTRIVDAIGLIRHEWDELGSAKRGLRISIGDRVIRTHR